MVIQLPWPPSINHYWRRVMIRGKPRTLLSERGRQYRKDATRAIALCSSYRPAQSFGDARLSVTITAYEPDRRERDLDNLLKAPLDALAHCGVYADDSQIDVLTIRRELDREHPHLLVEIVAL